MREALAACFLENNGVRITHRNFHGGRRGEIDLIGYDGEYLVFFEVKFRSSLSSGFPEEAVTIAKQRTICRVADYFRTAYPEEDTGKVRFDVVALTDGPDRVCHLRWIKNAFEYHGR